MFTPAVPAHWQGTAMGIYGASEDLGIIIGSGAGGFVWSGLGPSWVFLMGSLSCILGAMVCIGFLHEKSLRLEAVRA